MHDYVAKGKQLHLIQLNKLKIYHGPTLIDNRSTKKQISGTIVCDGGCKTMSGEE